MAKSARIYDFTLTAGGSFQLNTEGSYVRIMSATGMVELVTDTFRIGPIQAGQGTKGQPFKRLTINDRSGAGNVGTVLVADADFIDQTILGSVNVIDGGKARTLALQTFMSNQNGGVPAAGIYSNQALKNPAGSGKNLIIKTICVSGQNATLVNFGRFAVGLTNTGFDNSGISKNFSSVAASVGVVQSDVTNYNTPYSTSLLGQMAIVANGRDAYKFDEPVIVTPGQCLRISSNTPAIAISGGFEWFEESQ